MPRKKVEKKDYSAQNKWKKANSMTVAVNLFRTKEEDAELLKTIEAAESHGKRAKELMRKGLLYEQMHVDN